MTRLTDSDRLILAQCDQFREQNGIAAIREDTGEPDTIAALVTELGKARRLVGELTAMVRRMDEAMAAYDRLLVLERLWLARCELSPEVMRAMDNDALAKHLDDAHPEDGTDD